METASISTDPDIVEKVILGILMSILITIAILGNLLVCIAVLTDASLRKLSNLFFVSLALSDLLLASVVMPFAMVNDLTTSFVDWFGQEFCKFWIASDVMLCTASIINLLLISFDRYVHIKDPLQYTRWITRKSVPIAIALTWIISALISFIPISLDLHMPNNEESSKPLSLIHSTTKGETSYEETETVMSAINSSISYNNGDDNNKPVKSRYSHESRKDSSYLSSLPTNDNSFSNTESYSIIETMRYDEQHGNLATTLDPEPVNFSDGHHHPISMGTSVVCVLDFSPVYSITSSFVSFFLPSIVMLTIYFHLYAIAQRHSKSMRASLTLNRASLSSVLSPLQRIRSNRSTERSNGNTNILRSLSINNKDASNVKMPTRVITNHESVDELETQQQSPISNINSNHNSCVKSQTSNSNEPIETTVFLATAENTERGSVVVVKTTQIQTPDSHSSFSSTNRSRPKNVNFSTESINARMKSYGTEPQNKSISVLLKTASIQSTIVAPESQNNNNPQLLQEHKAAVTIGIIMGVFLLCWTPFFVVNVVSGFCKDCISPTAFKVLTWLGYSNSSFNPVIYSIFNKEFRCAFKKVITSGPRTCFRAIAPSCIIDRYADDLKKAEKNSRLYRMQNPS